VIIDTSALVAILLTEPEYRSFNRAIEMTSSVRLSTASWVETSIVIEARLGAEGLRHLDRLVAAAGIGIVPVDHEQGIKARDAFSRFGKGRHPAGLNFGDCFSYALAKVTREQLLCKGNDFAQTDLPLHSAST